MKIAVRTGRKGNLWMNDTNYAGFWWRWLAMCIDGLILLLPRFLLGLIAAILCQISMPGQDPKVVQGISTFVGMIWGVILTWLYFALMESSTCQATLGKRLCKLKVTDMDGDQLTFARATGRYFGKFISNLTCSVGYIMAAFTERKQALHDKVASTLVVRVVPSGSMGNIPAGKPE
jgi:uncharacterized RDD family membrane protein YckC